MPEQSQRKTSDIKMPRLTGMKKRQQIEVAGRTMFVWVAIAAVALSFCIATCQYLFTKWDFNNKIISKKNIASQTLTNNYANAQKLIEQVDNLSVNQALASVKTSADDPNTKSILDALPTTDDPAALATSLQQVILSRSGVTIENISVPTTTADAATTGSASTSITGPQQMEFSVSVSGTYDKIKTLVDDFNRTIRPMKIVDMTLNGSDANLRATFDMVTYYQAAQSVSLDEETVQ